MTQLDIPATFRGSPTDDGEPWIGYIRVSTWKEERISPELQKTSIEGWARRTGRRIVRWIVDLDASGRNFKRKIMQGVAAVERREACGIAVWKYSRFGRTRDGVAINLKRVEDAGGQLESATEQVDARTATGRLQRGILFEFAAYESDKLGEQWRETHDHRRYKLGLPATGRPRAGYVWHPRRMPDGKGGWTTQKEWYEVDPQFGPAVTEAYRKYIDGEAFYAVCGWLNANGYRTVRDALWSVHVLTRYMDSGFAAGLLRVHDPKCKCKYGEGGSCPSHIFIPGAHEELISAELWQQYQERRRKVKATPPRARNATYALTGLMKCGGCRGTATPSSALRKGEDGQTHNVRGHAYNCGRRGVTATHGCEGVWIHRERVEKEVFKWLVDKAAPGVDAAPSVPQQRAEVVDERAKAARERARLQAEVDKLAAGLARLRAEHAVSPEEYGPGEYEAARDRIRKQQATAQAALEKVAAVEAMPDRTDFVPLVVGLVEEWETLDVREMNGLLKQLIRRVVLVRKEAGQDNVDVVIHPVWEPDPWPDPRGERDLAEFAELGAQ